jgi:ubiquitin-conjugating enzyme E2 Z
MRRFNKILDRMAATKRAAADLAELQKPLYAESGIYYFAEDENVMMGKACIFGPQGSPYEDCPMMYDITIGNTFPFDPPTVKFTTYDGRTRFHPNMYVEGKVCLSILGTWAGPKWTSIMRISTILVTLQSLMDSAPLRHEPGFEVGRDEMSAAYAKFVEWACIQYTLTCIENPSRLGVFEECFQERMQAIMGRLEARLATLAEAGEVHFVNLPYSLSGLTKYRQAHERLVKLKSAAIGESK